jgi:hypothetical protein
MALPNPMQGHSPEAPAIVRRFATPVAFLDLAKEAVVAVVVIQVETFLGVLVLDLEQRVGTIEFVLGLGTHALRLAWRKASREHAILLSAGIIDPSLGLFFVVLPAEEKASSCHNFCRSDDSEEDGGGELHGESRNGE